MDDRLASLHAVGDVDFPLLEGLEVDSVLPSIKYTSLKEIFDKRTCVDKVQSKLQAAMETIRKTLDQYGPCGTAVSFNGGKDCTITLFLYAVALEEYYCLHSTQQVMPIKLLYVSEEHSFPEIEQFVNTFTKILRADLTRVVGGMKVALKKFLDLNQQVKAILMGQRATDPHSDQLKKFDATNNGWPFVMRVHPILDWEYEDVWAAILGLKIPYCSLYSRGYTSIGNVKDTLPNPLLKSSDNPNGYLHAKYLEDSSKERSGRISK
ncbi:hypothetical protein BDV3_003487 [Batrachochytrium dendrobatidis]|nr:3'-phosphoadenosine 5'-phosphosulfate sulfotransferase [Batrachochytrium dendrobatidis]KAK5669338.1 3'-phosphoadenosine 5'-phosphosulfate sulfotransferase [Batrachochytrium dendrobatidis]